MDTWRPKGKYSEVAVGWRLNTCIGKDLNARELQQKGGKAGLLEQRYVSQGQHLLRVFNESIQGVSVIIVTYFKPLSDPPPLTHYVSLQIREVEGEKKPGL
jgi:hypothetical protein